MRVCVACVRTAYLAARDGNSVSSCAAQATFTHRRSDTNTAVSSFLDVVCSCCYSPCSPRACCTQSLFLPSCSVFQTGHRVQAQATIAPLSPHNPSVQHILVMSFDGFLYAIDGKSGCAHAVDIGENSYAAVLVDDLCGDGMLELLVSTMNGNVYMLQTQVPYHPLKTWTAQVRKRRGSGGWRRRRGKIVVCGGLQAGRRVHVRWMLRLPLRVQQCCILVAEPDRVAARCACPESHCCVCWCCCHCVQVQGINGLVARWNHFGFAATPTARQLRDVAGQQLQVGWSHSLRVSAVGCVWWLGPA